MTTTNLFVELIVIGVGGFAWLGLLVLALLGFQPQSLMKLIELPAAAIPALALIYLLGIVTDRMADAVFQAIRGDGKRHMNYDGGSKRFFLDRTFVLATSEQFARQYEYSRSRQRICRGWAFNAVAILVSFNLFMFVRNAASHHLTAIWIMVSLILAGIAASCWLAWELMSNAELKSIRLQADVLRSIDKSSSGKRSKG